MNTIYHFHNVSNFQKKVAALVIKIESTFLHHIDSNEIYFGVFSIYMHIAFPE